MSTNIDARGLACPQPVIAAKKALDSITGGIVTVLVDNTAAKENVTKLAVANNCGVSIEEQGGYFQIKITKGASTPVGAAAPAADQEQDVVYFISNDTLGQGSDELGAILMKSFFFTLTEAEFLPRLMLFVNGGVRLTTEDSPVLSHVKQLAEKGVVILSCGTCLDYFQLKERLAVGEVTNMYTILAELNKAGKAITL